MSRLTSEHQASLSRWPGEEWRDRPGFLERRYDRGPSNGLLLAGLIAAGVLGGLAWYYLGPDLRRYMKLRNM
jgi:hypothetical protein